MADVVPDRLRAQVQLLRDLLRRASRSSSRSTSTWRGVRSGCGVRSAVVLDHPRRTRRCSGRRSSAAQSSTFTRLRSGLRSAASVSVAEAAPGSCGSTTRGRAVRRRRQRVVPPSRDDRGPGATACGVGRAPWPLTCQHRQPLHAHRPPERMALGMVGAGSCQGSINGSVPRRPA